MNAINEVIKLAGKSQTQVCKITGIKQSLLSYQMNHEIVGSIEKSIEIARELNVKRFSFEKNGAKITVKL